jgi:two-component SAPR family response regulator
LAEVYFATNRRKEMLAPLQRALDLSARFDYEYWLRGEIRRNPRLFADEEVIEKLPLDLRELARSQESKIKIPKEIPATVTEQVSTLTDLTIRTFGFVEIFRDKSKPFAPDAWTTRRARDIFCFIATSKHRRVEKEVLIDVFWGEEDLATIEKNFHPTISHIRKALNSRQSFKQNFLIFRDGAYQLNPELAYSIDTEEFEAAIAKAEKAKKEKDYERLRENLEKALEIYRGDYMSGVYENWADERRLFYSEQHSRVLTGLSKLAFSSKNWSDALKFTNQILQKDPFREDAHRLAMKIYAAQGKRSAVIEQFENLQKLLKKELGIVPSGETRRVFQELLR